jgi:endonuclease/exonuclease/phosphatase family metal-dependent hydrolase
MPGASLKICSFNVENLFLSLEYYRGGGFDGLSEMEFRDLALAQFRRRQKPLRKLWGLAQAMLDINADIFMLVEVGGPDSLANFNRHFLEDRYDTFFLEGNSKRNIDLGFLVKKERGLHVETYSNRELPVEVRAYQGSYRARFSRDVAELRVLKDGAPALICLLTHLKSKISSDQDFRGADLRSAEARALAAFYEAERKKFPGVPIILGGDFNAELDSEELAPLRQTDLLDFQDVRNASREERTSIIHITYHGEALHQVIDYMLISPDLKEHVVAGESGVYRYKGFYDIPDPLPTTMREKFRLPSDHYPLVLTLRY